nr:putative transcription elongation factor SPT5 homolog 1 [Tanacetum cinerariifolium]
STLFANRKKGHFLKGDRVIIVKGEKVEENIVHIKPNATGLPETIAVNERELCKYFEPGNHVKVVSGAQEGVTGMVIAVEGHLVNIVSDTTKEAEEEDEDDDEDYRGGQGRRRGAKAAKNASSFFDEEAVVDDSEDDEEEEEAEN